MAGDPEEFERAKTEAEPLFCQVLDSHNPDFPYRVIWREQTNGAFDKQGHTDVECDVMCPDGFIERAIFDIKDVKRKNFGTGNYTLKQDCIEYFKKYRGLSFFAFRLNDGKEKRLDSFVIVPTKDVVSNFPLKQMDNGEYLCSLAEIKEKCPIWWTMEKDF